MVTSFPLFDEPVLWSLLKEFRATMRRLLVDLCDELDDPYRQASLRLRVPTGFMRAVEASLNSEDFSNWKVVGWIEELNDLVYLLDVREQLRREADPRGFAEAFYSSCESQFYEHGYLEELFPEGRPKGAALARRLSRHGGQQHLHLCIRQPRAFAGAAITVSALIDLLLVVALQTA